MRTPTPQQLPSGSWRIQIMNKGKRISKVFSTEDEARCWAESVKDSYKKGNDVYYKYEKYLKSLEEDSEKGEVDTSILPSVASELNQIDEMDGRAFEKYCANLFSFCGLLNGSKISLTKKAVDFGADIIIECLDGIKVSVQCKRLKSSVKVEAIQEVVASKKHYDTKVAVVITNSSFSRSAQQLAKENDVVLIGRKTLVKLIKLKIKTLDMIVNHRQWYDFLCEIGLQPDNEND